MLTYNEKTRQIISSTGWVYEVASNTKFASPYTLPIGTNWNDYSNNYSDKQNTQPSGDVDLLIDITWSDLVALRDAAELAPGAHYRITDYETTTVQPESQSAGHLFDVIVFALDNKTLSEEACAIHSVRDTERYFADSNLGAWKLKYCLDNDPDKFAWADTINGKGVIYQMIDEYNNDVPYDFKNIQFKRYKIIEHTKNHDFDNQYFGFNFSKTAEENTFYPSAYATLDTEDFKWFYTFTGYDDYDDAGTLNIIDLSTNQTRFEGSEGSYTRDNKFGSYAYGPIDSDTGFIHMSRLNLGNNVILYRSSFNTFMGIYNNIIGDSFCYNTIGYKFCSNTVGINFTKNIIDTNFLYNKIANDFYENVIGSNFRYNTVGTNFYNNYAINCSENTIGINFQNNFLDNFNNNATGNGISSNTFSYICYYNTFGDSFMFNNIGENFQYNTVGDSVMFITIPQAGFQYSNIYSGLQGLENTPAILNTAGSTAQATDPKTYQMCKGTTKKFILSYLEEGEQKTYYKTVGNENTWTTVTV